jgi:hypothetical protein
MLIRAGKKVDNFWRQWDFMAVGRCKYCDVGLIPAGFRPCIAIRLSGTCLNIPRGRTAALRNGLHGPRREICWFHLNDE